MKKLLMIALAALTGSCLQADFWGDVKETGKSVFKETKKAAKDVGQELSKAGKEVGREVFEVGKKTGKEAVDSGKELTREVAQRPSPEYLERQKRQLVRRVAPPRAR